MSYSEAEFEGLISKHIGDPTAVFDLVSRGMAAIRAVRRWCDLLAIDGALSVSIENAASYGGDELREWERVKSLADAARCSALPLVRDFAVRLNSTLGFGIFSDAWITTRRASVLLGWPMNRIRNRLRASARVFPDGRLRYPVSDVLELAWACRTTSGEPSDAVKLGRDEVSRQTEQWLKALQEEETT